MPKRTLEEREEKRRRKELQKEEKRQHKGGLDCRRFWPIVFPIVFGSLWLLAMELLWIMWGVWQDECNYNVQAEVTNLAPSPTFFNRCDVAIQWACPAERCDRVFTQVLNYPAPYCSPSQQQRRGQLISGCVKEKNMGHFFSNDDIPPGDQNINGDRVVIPAGVPPKLFIAALVVTGVGAPLFAGLIAWAVFKVRRHDAWARAQERAKEQAMSAVGSSDATDGHVTIHCKSAAPQHVGAQEDARDDSSDRSPLLQKLGM